MLRVLVWPYGMAREVLEVRVGVGSNLLARGVLCRVSGTAAGGAVQGLGRSRHDACAA